jgi:hypothetical protein
MTTVADSTATMAVEETPPGGVRGRFYWPAPMPSGRDQLIAAVATLVAMGITMLGSTNGWFFGDAWDFLVNRDLTDFTSLVRPHAGHLQFPVSLVYQLIYEQVGLDYWPWFLLPRVIGYGAMVYVFWLVVRRRGADPTVAWLTLAVLLVYGSSTFLTAATIGHHLVIPAVALAAAMYAAGGPRWLWGDQLFFAGLILLLVVSTSSGIAGAAALGIVGLCLGRFWRVAPGFIPAAVAYLGWLATTEDTGATSASVKMDSLLAVPTELWEMMAPAVARTLAFPMEYGPVLVLVLVGALLVWTFRRELGTFEAVWVVMAVVWMTMAIVVRVASGTIAVGATRYGYLLSLFLVPAVVPHIRLARNATVRRLTVAAIVVVVIAGNAASFGNGLRFWEDLSAQVRDRTHAVGLLLAAGEPAVEENTLFPPPTPPGADSVRVRTVRALMEEGWEPDPSQAGITEELARGLMRMSVLPGPAGHSCQRMDKGDTLSIRTEDYPAIALGVTVPTTVEVSYIDSYGSGERTVELTGDHVLDYPEGASALMLLRVTGGGPLAVCQPSLVVTEDVGTDEEA